MSNKSIRSANRPRSIAQQAAADCKNRALEKSDIAKIFHSIGAVTRLYNISDLAKKSGGAGPSIHRAFAGDPRKPNFTTVLNVLDAMGFQLHVTMRRDVPARAPRVRSVANCQEPER